MTLSDFIVFSVLAVVGGALIEITFYPFMGLASFWLCLVYGLFLSVIVYFYE